MVNKYMYVVERQIILNFHVKIKFLMTFGYCNRRESKKLHVCTGNIAREPGTTESKKILEFTHLLTNESSFLLGSNSIINLRKRCPCSNQFQRPIFLHFVKIHIETTIYKFRLHVSYQNLYTL